MSNFQSINDEQTKRWQDYVKNLSVRVSEMWTMIYLQSNYEM